MATRSSLRTQDTPVRNVLLTPWILVHLVPVAVLALPLLGLIASDLIRDLKKAGVEVFVCGQSLHDLGFKTEEVAAEVPVADSAMLVLVNKQADGYAYIPAR